MVHHNHTLHHFGAGFFYARASRSLRSLGSVRCGSVGCGESCRACCAPLRLRRSICAAHAARTSTGENAGPAAAVPPTPQALPALSAAGSAGSTHEHRSICTLPGWSGPGNCADCNNIAMVCATCATCAVLPACRYCRVLCKLCLSQAPSRTPCPLWPHTPPVRCGCRVDATSCELFSTLFTP